MKSNEFNSKIRDKNQFYNIDCLEQQIPEIYSDIFVAYIQTAETVSELSGNHLHF